MGQLALLTQPPFPSNAALSNQSLSQSSKQFSRDEMNLAEFPLTVLSTRINSNTKTLEFSDSIKGKNGELINRQWMITGADKFGLPTASDDEVLLGLLKMTSDDGFQSPKIYFSRYELLKVLRWSTEGRSYTRLHRALDRLSGVRIKASNGFFDNEAKLHSTRNFGIIDAYEINDGRGQGVQPKPSFFIWSETIFKSFQSGFIKKLDLDYLFSLSSAVSKRLYRYLDKHFWYRARVQQNLFTLAHEKIGISRNYQYASQIKQQIDPAIEELIERGFLLGVEYLGKGSDTEIVFHSANGARRLAGETQPAVVQRKPVTVREDISDEGSDSGLRTALVSRGLRPAQVDQILKDLDENGTKRVREIIQYFDELIQQESSRISRSPVGFLYSAVTNPFKFILPSDNRRMVQRKVSSPPPDKSKQEGEESIYLIERKREIERLMQEIEPELREKLQREVESALSKLRDLISPHRFDDAVRHGVEEKLARLFALPDFTEWQRLRQGANRARPQN